MEARSHGDSRRRLRSNPPVFSSPGYRFMKDIFELEPNTRIQQTSYILSYPHLLSYFSKDLFDAADVVRGAHMVYGWMPTVLNLYPGGGVGLDEAADLLTHARKTGMLSDRDLLTLKRIINNSLVGVSKLLHFAAPNHFAIWDSNIYEFVFQEKAHGYRVDNIDKYHQYLRTLTDLQADCRFSLFHQSVNARLGYEVSKFRALELVMFLNAPKRQAAAVR